MDSVAIAQITVDFAQHVPDVGDDGWHWWTALVTLFYRYPLIGALLNFMLLDVITGVIAGYITKELSSSTSFRGMSGKAMILAMVSTGTLMEFVIPGVPWGQFLALFFCITEAISITENAGRSGVPIPQQWMDALEKLREKKAAEKVQAVQPMMQVNAHEINIETNEQAKPEEPRK